MPEMMLPWMLLSWVLLASSRTIPRNSFSAPLIVVVPDPLAAPKPITFPVMVIEPRIPLDELNEMPE